eukprot:SM000018S03735  [mRNA]  locus=s18:1059431:1066193:- [translate_table: standard]
MLAVATAQALHVFAWPAAEPGAAASTPAQPDWADVDGHLVLADAALPGAATGKPCLQLSSEHGLAKYTVDYEDSGWQLLATLAPAALLRGVLAVARLAASPSSKLLAMVVCCRSSGIPAAATDEPLPAASVAIIGAVLEWGIQWTSAIELRSPTASICVAGDDRVIAVSPAGHLRVWDLLGTPVAAFSLAAHAGLPERPALVPGAAAEGRGAPRGALAFCDLVTSCCGRMVAAADKQGNVYLADLAQFPSRSAGWQDQQVASASCASCLGDDLSSLDHRCAAGLPSSPAAANLGHLGPSGFTPRTLILNSDSEAPPRPSMAAARSSLPSRRLLLTGGHGWRPVALAFSAKSRVIQLAAEGGGLGLQVSCCSVAISTPHDDQLDAPEAGCSPIGSLHYDAPAVAFAVGGCLWVLEPSGLSTILPISMRPPSEHSSRLPCPEGRRSLVTESSLWSPASQRAPSRRRPLWQQSVMERASVLEGPDKALRLSSLNGWEAETFWMQQLEVALASSRKPQSILRQFNDEAALTHCRPLQALAALDRAPEALQTLIFAAVADLQLAELDSSSIRQCSDLLLLASRFSVQLLCSLEHSGAGKAGDGGGRASMLMADIAHHLETVRELQKQAVIALNRRTEQNKVTLTEGQGVQEPNEGDTDVTLAPGNLMLIPEGNSNAKALGRRSAKDIESSAAMIHRWRRQKCSIREVVIDALRAGRLALAVAHLKLNFTAGEPSGPFEQIYRIGRSLTYTYLREGRVALALDVLQELGEDLQAALTELMLGSTHRDVRLRSARILDALVALKPADLGLLNTISNLEGMYPGSSFWEGYRVSTEGRAKSQETAPPQLGPEECGEVEAVVLGEWSFELSNGWAPDLGSPLPVSAYFCAAATWVRDWDKETVDRVCLERNSHHPTDWATRFAFLCAARNLDALAQLVSQQADSAFDATDITVRTVADSPDETAGGPHPALDVLEEQQETSTAEPIYEDIVIPGMHILTEEPETLHDHQVAAWLDVCLARRLCFRRSHWQDSTVFLSLLARAKVLLDGDALKHAPEALHVLVVKHCIAHTLAHLLQLYISRHGLQCTPTLNQSVASCSWAHWWLCANDPANEYQASFHNMLAILELPQGTQVSTLKTMAEMGGASMAIATLVHAPVSPQECLASVAPASTWHCPLESLRSLQARFPILFNALAAAAAKKESTYKVPKPLRGQMQDPAAGLSTYLKWRESLFTSARGDATLQTLLPRKLPKKVRSLLHLSIQGVAGMAGVSHEGLEVAVAEAASGESAAQAAELAQDRRLAQTWESATEDAIKRDLHASSSETGNLEIGHLLARGRPLAAFAALLGGRDTSAKEDNVLLAPLSAAERDQLLPPVMALALSQNGSSWPVVAACAAFLAILNLPEDSQQVRANAAALRCVATNRPSDLEKVVDMLRAHHFMSVLQALERALRPLAEDSARSAGAWLAGKEGLTGTIQDARAAQVEARLQWQVVSAFCRAHGLPPSDAYLRILAQRNDWVGFLVDAQTEDFPLDALVSLAGECFNDAGLRSHVAIVLQSLRPKRELAQSDSSVNCREELFTELARCE